jgi:hypothetical protein
MNKQLRLTIALLACGIAAVGAGAADSNTSCRVILELTDGSRVVGTPRITSLPVQTDFAKVDVPLHRVRTVKLAADHGTATLTLANGDRLQGRLALAPLVIETCFGKASIPLNLIANVAVTAGGARTETVGLVLHYTFDDDEGGKVVDKSGSENHGEIVGNVTYEDSFRGKAIRIGGPRSYVVSASKALNADGWTEFASCAWVLIKGGGTPYGPILMRGEVTGARQGFCHMGTGGPYGGHWNDAGAGIVLEQATVSANPKTFSKEANPAPAMNQWYHLALTYDGRTVCMYVNGALDASTPVDPPFQKLKDWPDTKLVIGSSGATPTIDWGDMYFDGLIDEVRIYKRALGAEEVKGLYDAKSAESAKDK